MKLKALSGLSLAALLGFAALALAQRPTPVAADQTATAGRLELFDRSGAPAGACPLKHTAVEADIAGFVARVTVKQRFENPSKTPLEAIYTFPLPADAAVDDMTMLIGDRVIRGEIKKKEEARAIYEAARSAGQSAALLDQERPNIFTQAIANLMPKAPVTISISYVQLLKHEAGIYEFTYPMVVGPRYTPEGGYRRPGERGAPSRPLEPAADDHSVVHDADKITPPITPPNTRAGHDISVRVNLDAGLPLGEIRSQLHQVDVRRTGDRRAVVQLAGGKTIPNKDFILRYGVAGDALRSGILTHATGKGDGSFALVVQPPKAPPAADVAPKEMVFVIDQTGSQSGLPIEKAKEALKFCLENLNPRDTFQVLAFNTEVRPCFPAPVELTEATFSQAQGFIAPLQGDGGTDILKAASYALRIPADPTRPRIVCYMTDGYVGNDMQILEFIRKNRGEARMFPIGVGNSVNRFLIEGMAREGRGAPFILTLNTPGAEAAARFYERISHPLLLDVQVDWNGLPVAEVYPKAIPDVFSHGPIIIKGRFTQPAAGEVTIRGLLRGRPWSETMRVEFPREDRDGSAITTLWAREKIEDLQSSIWEGQQLGRPDSAIVDQIVGLALDYRLLTQHTSFVAVEKRVVNFGGRQKTVDVPVEIPEGVRYEGIFGEEARQDRGMGMTMSKSRAMAFSRGAQTAAPAGAAGGGLGSIAAGQSAQVEYALATAPAPALLRSPVPELKEEQLARDAAKKPARPATPDDKCAASLLASRTDRKWLEVHVRLLDPPKEYKAELKRLGFDLAVELTPGSALLGRIRGTQLDALLKLKWVIQVTPPRFTMPVN